MVSYRNLFFVKAMTAWNVLVEGWKGTMAWWKSWSDGIRGWFHPDAGSWFLYPDSLFPVSFCNRYGLEDAPWRYEPASRRLIKKGGGSERYRVGWLSAQTTAGGGNGRGVRDTRDMDVFLEELRIDTEAGTSPPLTVLLQAWSLYDKRWWLAEEGMRLEWIDADAEEHTAGPREDILLPLVRMDEKAWKASGEGKDLKKN